MFRLGLLFVTILFLIGCTTKKEDSLLKSYHEKIDYHKQLQKTEKIQLYENNETKVVLVATHLYTSNYEKKDTRDEVFIIGLDIENEDINDTVALFGIQKPDKSKKVNDEKPKKNKKQKKKIPIYGLTINGKKAIAIKELDTNDARLKKLSFVTEWGNYYLVTFKHVKNKRFSLVFNSNKYGKGTLHFAKVAKYVYTKKGF